MTLTSPQLNPSRVSSLRGSHARLSRRPERFHIKRQSREAWSEDKVTWWPEALEAARMPTWRKICEKVRSFPWMENIFNGTEGRLELDFDRLAETDSIIHPENLPGLVATMQMPAGGARDASNWTRGGGYTSSVSQPWSICIKEKPFCCFKESLQ